jgi:hypothetical protein
MAANVNEPRFVAFPMEVIGVFGVKKADEQRLRDVCRDSGVRDVHYFGTLAID